METHFGIMLDCSRNGVMKVSAVKRMINCMAKMGYNTLELYLEDTYEVEGEPYFGIYRGRYTINELKEIDDYAQKHGIELIPCIQTLAHFTNLVKLPQYGEIVDCYDILLIDDERTYELIEKIFSTLQKAFTSRLVNIGMDEAHYVGLGKYLKLHGYVDSFELLLRHLNRVVEIAEKYGFTPHMWSDMFFRLASGGEYYAHDVKIDETVIEKVPENVQLTYWDYYHVEKQDYDDMFKAHKEFNRKIWFAGGAWSWSGFAPQNRHTQKTMLQAMRSVREHDVKDVLITMWGDNGKECSFFALLPSLYAIKKYYDGVEDETEIKRGFNKTFGLNFDSFMLLDLPNETRDGKFFNNTSKSLFYSDCFINGFDSDLQYLNADYGKRATELYSASKKAGEYAYVFRYLSSLCSVLDVKATLSLRTRLAYKSGNKKELSRIVKDYDTLVKRLETFHYDFFVAWRTDNKDHGFETHDARIGGVIRRVKTCRDLLKEFIDGKITEIQQLDDDVTFINRNGINWYNRLVSASEI